MNMTGFLGKKVDLVCKDGKKYSGYVVEIEDAEDSGIGKESIGLDPITAVCEIVIATDDIESVRVDPKYKEFDFLH